MGETLYLKLQITDSRLIWNLQYEIYVLKSKIVSTMHCLKTTTIIFSLFLINPIAATVSQANSCPDPKMAFIAAGKFIKNFDSFGNQPEKSFSL